MIYQYFLTGGLQETEVVGPDAETYVESEMRFVGKMVCVFNKRNEQGPGSGRRSRIFPAAARDEGLPGSSGAGRVG